MTITTIDQYQAGESLTQEFTIEEDGSAKDITGASVSWYLLTTRGDANADAVLDDSDTGVSASITDAANGRIDVSINQDTTTDLAGNYWQRLAVDDSGDGKQIWGGTVRITQP